MTCDGRGSSRAVVRVFFASGLFKTASIDGSVTASELVGIVVKKVKIERSAAEAAAMAQTHALYEARDESKTPWRRSPLGTWSRRVDAAERPYAIVQSWVARGIVPQSRFLFAVAADRPTLSTLSSTS
jgi:hypothetical protein